MSCPPAHIHQRCLASDAPNLLVFVRGSIKNHSPRASHLFPFYPPALLRMVHLLPAPVLTHLFSSPSPRCPATAAQLPSPSTPRPFRGITAERVQTDAPSGPDCRLSCRQALAGGWSELRSVDRKDQCSFVHKITANKLQITQDTFIIDLCRGAESSITFCLAQGA